MSQPSELELNARLKQLALEAQRYPPRSQERRIRLERLFREIQKWGQLANYRSLCPPHLQGCYEDIYADAVQKLYCFITENIERYNTEQGEVLQWANGHLRYRFLDTLQEYQRGNRRASQEIQILSLDQLDTMPITDNSSSPCLSEQVIQVIKEDPEGIFVSTYTCGNPQANFQFIALKRYDGYGWKKISEELGIEISALSNFYQRCLSRFKTKIQEYLAG